MARSNKFPAAPPRTRAKAQERRLSRWRERQSITLTQTTAAMESATRRMVRNWKSESLKTPKATPRFSEWTMSKRPGMTLISSEKETLRSTISFVARSKAKTPAAKANDLARVSAGMGNLGRGRDNLGRGACMRSKGRVHAIRGLLRPTEHLFHRAGAGGADSGEARVRTHVVRVFPAAFAL